jgi:hypothetical protein
MKTDARQVQMQGSTLFNSACGVDSWVTHVVILCARVYVTPVGELHLYGTG